MMIKKWQTIFILVVSFSSFSFGQQALEAEKPMSAGLNNSLTLELPNAQIETIEEEWIDFIKKYKGKKNKKNKKTNEIFTDNATIKGMSNNTVDVYAKVVPMGKGCQLITWYNLGGAYLSSAKHPDAYWIGQALLKDFHKGYLIKEATSDVSEKEKELKKLKGDLSDLEKTQKDQAEKMEELKKELEKLAVKIEENQQKQEEKKAAVSNQKTALEEAKTRLNNAKQRQ